MIDRTGQLQILQLLEAAANGRPKMRKAVTTGTLTPVVPQDLEMEAHNTLWSETKETELTLLKLIPSTPATQVQHEYSRVTSFGDSRGSGFFGERSLPQNTSIGTERIVNNIRLMGEIGSTFLLAELEKTQRVLGTSGASSIERRALRLNTLRKKNRNLYRADTGGIRQGSGGVRFKGIEQLIREGTDGTTATSPFGSHVIDMLGLPLTSETVRNRAADAIVLFGFPTVLLMGAYARADFERSLDPATRLPMPIDMKPYMIGQYVAGLQTQGGIVKFHTDNTLAARWYRGQYIAEGQEGGPTTTPTVVASAGAVGGGRTSLWDANSAGDVYYVVTEQIDELEGLGTRYPATVGTFTTVAVGEEVTLTLTPGNALADGFKVYRGSDADTADPTGAWFIFEVANTGAGAAVVAYDDNDERPNTERAFALNITSAAANALGRGPDSYYTAVEKSAEFFKMADDPVQNTIAAAELGPSMGILALASVLAEIDRPLMYSAMAPEVRNPFQNFVFKNIGRVS
jgi:hypothetical protein